MMDQNTMHSLKVLIVVKTYPIPSAKYDELVCTAGVTETGDFVRLYPINFRDLPYSRQYKKYQWLEVMATPHGSSDNRKESYRPDHETMCPGDFIKSNPGNWKERARYALAKKAQSMEELRDRQEKDGTSLGVFKPKKIKGLYISPDESEWKPTFKAELQQARIWETRTESLRNPPRKIPFKFHYRFECDDPRCKGHKMMIEDWEVGALFWKLVDQGKTHDEAAEAVKVKFLDELCGEDRDTHFFVGTVQAHPRSWVILGLFYPKVEHQPLETGQLSLELMPGQSEQTC